MSRHRLHLVANWVLILCVMTVMAMLQGCSSTKKADWNARVGNYTYDQAVAELGPPDKQATLSNTNTVAEWVTRRSGGGSISFGTGFYGSDVGVGVGRTVDSGSSDRWLRLVFDPTGMLVSWSRN